MQRRPSVKHLAIAAVCVLSAPLWSYTAAPPRAARPAATTTTRPATAPATRPATVRFLSAAQTAAALADDADPYFELHQTLEMSAKTGRAITGQTLSEQRAELRARYRQAALEFTDDEKAMLQAGVDRVYPALLREYPLFASVPWSFAKVADGVEGGLPHTRGEHIVLPRSRLAQLLRLSESSARQTAFTVDLAQLLVHEQVHVAQRRFPPRFERFYTRILGFERPRQIEGCPWLEAQQVVNPDATDVNWVFPVHNGPATRYIWPRVVLSDLASAPAVRRLPRDMWMMALEVEPGAHEGEFKVVTDADGRPVMEELLKVEAYGRAMAPSRYCFHPAEASADLFSIVFVTDCVLPELAGASRPDTAAAEKLSRWRKAFVELFAAK